MAMYYTPRVMPRLRREWAQLPEPRPEFHEWASTQGNAPSDLDPVEPRREEDPEPDDQ